MTKIIFLVAVAWCTLSLLHCASPTPSGQRNAMGEYRSGAKQKNRGSSKIDLVDACQAVKSMKVPAPLASTAELKTRFLDAHNEIRRLYKQKDLIWDDSLAAYAQRWAEHLKSTRQCTMQHRSHAGITEGKKLGENLAFDWTSQSIASGNYYFSPERVVKAWSVECEHYDYAKNSCAAGEQCGHFTQILWHSTTHVGCGMAICDDGENAYRAGRAEIWVCSYDPPGNYIGRWPL